MKQVRIQSISLILRLAFACLLAASGSWYVSACSLTGTTPALMTFSPSANPLDVGAVDSYPTGKLLGAVPSNQFRQLMSTDCMSSWASQWTVSNYAPLSLTISPGDGYTYPVYPTNITGIGYIMKQTAITSDAIRTASASSPIWTGSSPSGYAVGVGISFVTTGRLLPGSYTIASRLDAAKFAMSQTSNVQDAYASFNFGYAGFTLNVTGKTCTIDTNTIAQTVNLPATAITKISEVGATDGATPFSFSVSGCTTDIKLHATLTDVNNPNSKNNALANTGDATGVGIQILKDRSPVLFGPQSSVAGNTNQFYIGTGATSYSIPLVAQYVNTGTGAVTAGSVQSQAWVTFSYQ